jgi:hypothetical protein
MIDLYNLISMFRSQFDIQTRIITPCFEHINIMHPMDFKLKHINGCIFRASDNLTDRTLNHKN